MRGAWSGHVNRFYCGDHISHICGTAEASVKFCAQAGCVCVKSWPMDDRSSDSSLNGGCQGHSTPHTHIHSYVK